MVDVDLIVGAKGGLKSPKLGYKKMEGTDEPVAIASITVEVIEPDVETLRVLATVAHAGHPVKLTLTAEQRTF